MRSRNRSKSHALEQTKIGLGAVSQLGFSLILARLSIIILMIMFTKSTCMTLQQVLWNLKLVLIKHSCQNKILCYFLKRFNFNLLNLCAGR